MRKLIGAGVIALFASLLMIQPASAETIIICTNGWLNIPPQGGSNYTPAIMRTGLDENLGGVPRYRNPVGTGADEKWMVAINGLDNAVWLTSARVERFNANGAPGYWVDSWQSIGGVAIGSPHIGLRLQPNGERRLTVAVIGGDLNTYRKEYQANNSWTGWIGTIGPGVYNQTLNPVNAYNVDILEAINADYQIDVRRNPNALIPQYNCRRDNH